MTIKPVHILLFILLIAVGIAYRIQILIKPTFTFITLAEKNFIPAYLNHVRYFALESYLPHLTEKAVDKLDLNTIIDPESIYKIVTPENFNPTNIDACVQLSPLDIESHFIHAALGNQTEHILEKFFKNDMHVLFIELKTDALHNANLTLKKEQNKADGEYFPHLYGTPKIPLSIVKTVIELEKKDNTWRINTLSIVIPDIPK